MLEAGGQVMKKNVLPNSLTITSTTDAVTTHDSVLTTPRRARHVRRWLLTVKTDHHQKYTYCLQFDALCR